MGQGRTPFRGGRAVWLAALLALLLGPAAARAQQFRFGIHFLEHRLAGKLVNHTKNHLGGDNRIWSPTLGEKRDLYVYLPPGYDPCRRYPVMVWLHGIIQDERAFPWDGLQTIDAAIAAGRMPPLIVAIPDGTIHGRPSVFGPKTLFLNSELGRFEDYVVQDVWGFVQAHYPIRPERQAHVIAGFSGGGLAAYRIAIRNRDQFGIVFGVSPPMNLRWLDCHGNYFGNFDPNCWGWREQVRGREVIGKFYGVVRFRIGPLVFPLYGRGPELVSAVSRDNPIEMLGLYDVRPGELAMLLGYGGLDQFNIDAQVESFVYVARQRGLDVRVLHAPRGRHNTYLIGQFMPCIIDWLAPQLAE